MDELIQEREVIQTKLNSIFNYFYTNNINQSTKLIDEQGYPRSDLDLYTITNYRSQLSKLENDLKLINSKLSEHLLDHHSKYTQPSQPSNNPPSHLKPWSIIDNILRDSPSWSAGLQTNDKIIMFGPFTHLSQNSFSDIPGFIKGNNLSPIPVQVLRNDKTNLSLTIHPNGNSIG